ncbi:MAG: SAM-dependent methyltransferase [Clostridia bacterium]|nr:SAM-dependent methyltransferase [Clostridia bacterium]
MLTDNQSKLLEVAKRAFELGCARMLVLSKPTEAGITKMRLLKRSTQKGELFVFETHLNDGRITQKNSTFFPADAVADYLDRFDQADLITENGDAIYKKSRKGKELLAFPPKLKAALDSGEIKTANAAPMNREKNRMLTGGEPFLYELGVSDKNGNVLPSRQSKFRQICRFLEFVRDICHVLPAEGEINVYDLCCGKCYLSFAVYHYFANVLGRKTNMLCADLKGDVLKECEKTAIKLGFDGMTFRCVDITKLETDIVPHLVLSLHACNTATDIVLETAVRLKAKAVLSTPCCHRELSKKINCAPLEFTTRFGILSDKLCTALTDGLRTLYLEKSGYTVTAAELIDPDDTPKNVMLRATLGNSPKNMEKAERQYAEAKKFLGIQ